MKLLIAVLFVTMIPFTHANESSNVTVYEGDSSPPHLVYDAVLRMVNDAKESRGADFALAVVTGGLNINPVPDAAGATTLLKPGEPNFVDQKTAKMVTDLLLSEVVTKSDKIRTRRKNLLCAPGYVPPTVDSAYEAVNTLSDIRDAEALASLTRVRNAISVPVRGSFDRWLVYNRDGFFARRHDSRDTIPRRGADVFDVIESLCRNLSAEETAK